MSGALRIGMMVVGLSGALFACSSPSHVPYATPLLSAAAAGESEQVEIQIAEGVDLDQPFAGETALMVAARAGRLRVVEILIAAGADVNAQTSRELEATALMMAARYGRIEIVEVLLDHGADADSRTSNGYTALMRAARNGKTNAVRLLVENGADVRALNRGGVSALYHATASNSRDIVEILLQAGADSTEIADSFAESANPFSRLRQTQRGRRLGDLLVTGLVVAGMALTALSIALVVKQSSSLWIALLLYGGVAIVGMSYLAATAHYGPIRIDVLLLIPWVALTYILIYVVARRGIASRREARRRDQNTS